MILTSLLSTRRPYRDRQKPANGAHALLSPEIGIFFMYYHIDMITHDTAFLEPVGGTGGDKLITF